MSLSRIRDSQRAVYSKPLSDRAAMNPSLTRKQFLNDFFATNANNLARLSRRKSPYVFELIRSRSKIDEQIATHKSTLPLLCGTKPSISFDSLESTLSAMKLHEEDTFIDASLDEIATFVKSKFSCVPEIISPTFFVVIDGDSPIDKSVTLVEILKDDDDLEGRERKDPLERVPEQVKTMILRRERLMKRSRGQDRVKLNTLRSGMALCPFLVTFGKTSWGMDYLKPCCALDGVHWGWQLKAKNPPPMYERIWIGPQVRD